MRILADVTTWAPGRSGIGLYTERLLQAMAAAYPEDAWLLASNVAGSLADIPGRHIGPRLPVRALWMQTAMAWHGWRQHVDIAFYPNYLGPLLPSAPMVATFHDMAVYLTPETFSLRKRELQRRLLPLVAARAAAILTPSASSRRDVIRLLDVDPKRVVVTPLAADERFFGRIDAATVAEIRGRFGLPARYLLAVGTLEPRKNLVRLVTAFERVWAHDRSVGLVLVGGKGWRDDAIRAALGSSPAREAILTTGYVEPHELHCLYQEAIALCYPSLYEGFGLPVVEAMAAGTAVLVSRGSSLDEVAGDAALAVPPLDVDAIAEGMGTLLHDDALRSRLVEAGAARAATLSWARTAASTRAVFARVIDGRAPDGSDDPVQPPAPCRAPPAAPGRAPSAAAGRHEVP